MFVSSRSKKRVCSFFLGEGKKSGTQHKEHKNADPVVVISGLWAGISFASAQNIC